MVPVEIDTETDKSEQPQNLKPAKPGEVRNAG
jgi:hypothetical protein